jgi:hypothetical protein
MAQFLPFYGLQSEEALVLLEHSAKLVDQAHEELAACELSQNLIDSMTTLQEKVSTATSTFKANAYLSAHVMSVKKKVEKPLSLRLVEFDAGKGCDGKYYLFEVPPPLAGMPCKPAFFDIAQNSVTEAPDLQSLLDAHQKKSGGILGWFRS